MNNTKEWTSSVQFRTLEHKDTLYFFLLHFILLLLQSFGQKKFIKEGQCNLFWPWHASALSRSGQEKHHSKLYCRYEYAKPCMINRIWGLKQLWLQVNWHAWFHLQRLRWPVRNGEGAKNSKWKYMCPAGFEPTPSSPRQESQRLRPLGHEGLMVISGLMSYRIMGYKLKKNCYVTTRVNLIMVTCVFELNVRLNFHFLSHCRF